MKNSDIEVLVDTNVITDNLKDGVRVRILENEPIQEYVSSDGIKITGSSLTKTTIKETTLSDIKNRIEQLNNEILIKTEELDKLVLKISEIEASIDTSIDEAIKNGATDNRTKK